MGVLRRWVVDGYTWGAGEGVLGWSREMGRPVEVGSWWGGLE